MFILVFFKFNKFFELVAEFNFHFNFCKNTKQELICCDGLSCFSSTLSVINVKKWRKLIVLFMSHYIVYQTKYVIAYEYFISLFTCTLECLQMFANCYLGQYRQAVIKDVGVWCIETNGFGTCKMFTTFKWFCNRLILLLL